MKNYKYILFDLDGTITDSKIGITKGIAYALNSFGINVENLDDLCKFIGPTLHDSFCEFYGFSEDDSTLAVMKYREYFSEIGIYENTVYDGIEELLQELISQGKIIIMATAKPVVFAKRILEYFALSKYFTFVSGSEFDGTRSKKSEVIAHALEQNKITDLSSVIMIGDRKHDVIGAKEIGIDVMGVLFGFGNRAEHEEAGADFIVNTVEEIGSFFKK